MSKVINLVKGDTYPEPNLTLKDSNTGEKGDEDSWLPIDLSLASVHVDFYRLGETDILATAICTKVGDGTAGDIFFRFPAAVANEEGNFEGEIVIDRSGALETVYKRFKVKVRGR